LPPISALMLCARTCAPARVVSCPQELINRSSFNALNQTLRSRFDVILYDTPACSSAADVLTIAARAGGVLLLVRKDRTRVADLTAFSDQLRRSGTEVVGSVLVSF